MERLCLFCKHFWMMDGCPDYSEVTPGEDFAMGCSKDHWDFDPNNCNVWDYRKSMETARTCDDFVHYTAPESEE